MNNIKIIHANKNHKKFLIYANKVIDNVNNMEETNGLELNIDKDYFRMQKILKYYNCHEMSNLKFYYKKV